MRRCPCKTQLNESCDSFGLCFLHPSWLKSCIIKRIFLRIYSEKWYDIRRYKINSKLLTWSQYWKQIHDLVILVPKQFEAISRHYNIPPYPKVLRSTMVESLFMKLILPWSCQCLSWRVRVLRLGANNGTLHAWRCSVQKISYTGTKMDQPLATSLGMETADATVSFKNQPMKLMILMTWISSKN